MARRPRWATPVRQVQIHAAPADPGLYRTVTGAERWRSASSPAGQARRPQDVLRRLSDHAGQPLLHHLSRLKEYGITTFQAEDEIAAICSAIGASYAGQLGVTSSSGPGSRSRPRRWASR